MTSRPLVTPLYRDALWWLYCLLLILVAPLWMPWALIRLLRAPSRERRERLGLGSNLPHPERQRLWFHGVSVGEVEALAPVIAAVERRMPEIEIVVSSTTPTGRARIEALYPHVLHRRFTPIDLPWTTRAAFRRIQPSALVLAESELWPALLSVASRRIPVVVVNGRISDQTFPRAQRFRGVYRWMLRTLTAVGVQTDEDRTRLAALGAPEDRLQVTGNVKFDRAIPRIPPEQQASLRQDLGVGNAPLLVAGSTFPGEDELLIDALGELRRETGLSELRLILVPRHPGRADAVETLIREAGYGVWRRSQGPVPAQEGADPEVKPDIVLIDTVGELATLYGLAHVAVIGRSFHMGGGQNPLEAMAHGVPVVYGPRMENFRAIAHVAESAGAALRCPDAAALVPALSRILQDPEVYARMAAAGPRALEAHKGAADRSALLIEHALENA